MARPRGILRSSAGTENIEHGRIAPSLELSPFVAHFWFVAWNLTGAPDHLVETLPHPSVHITSERGRTSVGGVSTGRFSRRLHGKGSVFGIKFRPAAFHAFFEKPLAQLTDRIVPIRSIFGRAGSAYSEAVLAESDRTAQARLAESLLLSQKPQLDLQLEMIRDLVESVAGDRSLIRVEQLCERANLDERNLQRAFRSCVGVSPKWVIQRYRLHEAAAQLEEHPEQDLIELALSLGYFDQAHFGRDFKKRVGRAPGAYAKEAESSRSVRASRDKAR